MKPGDKLLIIRIDDADGRAEAASELNGVEATIEKVDDDGTVHLVGYSAPVFPGRDVFTVTDVA